MERAYSLLTVKSMDEDKREIVGIATTPAVDRAGDIVEPDGAEFKLPIPLLWQHDSGSPVGHVLSAKVGKNGIEVVARFAKSDEPGKLKELLDYAWQCVKQQLVRGLSIGFKPLETARIGDSYSYRYIKWLWLELSAVTVPMNGEATITTIRSAYESAGKKTASGLPGGVVRLERPGVSGVLPSQPTQTLSKGTGTMKLQEMLAAFRAKQDAAKTAMNDLITKSGDEGRSLTNEEQQAYDASEAEYKASGAHIKRLVEHEKMMLETATPVGPTTGAPSGVVVPGDVERGTGYVSVKRNLDKGIAFSRFAKSLAMSRNNIPQAVEIAKHWHDSTPEVEQVLRAAMSVGTTEALIQRTAVAAGTTSSTTWAGPLVYYNNMVSEFIEYLRPMTVLGRLNQLRRVPFNIRIPRQTAGTTGSFVGEGAPKPVNALALDTVTLPWAKASCIVVLTDELVRMSNPAAEALVRDDLANGIAAYLDKRFLNPSFEGVANVSPASVTFGVTPRAASGVTLAALDDDVAYLMRQFSTNELSLMSGSWIMAPQTAINLSMMRTNQDQLVFPQLSMMGGQFYNLPVLTSNNAAPAGSPTDGHLYLIDQKEILLADDGEMVIDVSAEASLQMNDAPTAGATSLVSLWQTGQIGVKVDRWIYWTKRRSAAAQFIDNASYS